MRFYTYLPHQAAKDTKILQFTTLLVPVLIALAWYHICSIVTIFLVVMMPKLGLQSNLLEHKKINAIRQKKMMFGSFS